MATRLKDVAQSLGVSIVTVSKSLRNHPDIAKATRERVLQRVREMDYRPNLTARSLVTGRSSLVGLVVPDLVHPFFADVAKSLSDALRKKGYFLIVASSDDDPSLEEEEIEQMLAHRLDGLVVASCQRGSESLKRVAEVGPPLILLDRNFVGFPSHFVGADDYKVGALATEHLIASGKKRIAHIRGPYNNVGQARMEGYRETLLKHQLNAPDQYVISSADKADTKGDARGRLAMESILKLKPRPDAVFCFNDQIAMGAMIAGLQSGIDIPKEIALIGCGNFYYGEYLKVSLSTIDQNVSDIGENIARLIFRILDSETRPKPRRILVEPSLVTRGSTLSE